MKKKFFSIVLLFAIPLLIINCKDDKSSDELTLSGMSFGGYVYDISTGNKVTDYKITIDTATATYAGAVDPTTGKFTIVGVPFFADYVVKVEAAFYKTFISSHNMETQGYTGVITEGVTDSVMQPLQSFRTVALVPATVQHSAVTVNVLNSEDGSAVTAAGLYQLTRGTLNADITDLGDSDDLGSNTAGNGNIDKWAQDEVTLFGAFSGTSITIAAGTLDYGYDYTLRVYNVAGFQTKTLAIASYALNSKTDYTLTLQPESNAQGLSVIAVNSFDDNGNSVPLGSARSIIFYFNQQIELDPQWNTYSNGSPAYYWWPTEFITSIIDNRDVNNNGALNTRTYRHLFDGSNASRFANVTLNDRVFSRVGATISQTTTVSAKNSDTDLTLAANIFGHDATTLTYTYDILDSTTNLRNGNTSATAAFSLIDSTVNFLTGVANLNTGDYVADNAGNFARIEGIITTTNPNDTLLLSNDIMGLNEGYTIYNLRVTGTPTRPTVATNVTNWITAAASGNRLTITLAADSTILAEGVYDSADDLIYNINLDHFYVRQAGTSSRGWEPLSEINGWGTPLTPNSSIPAVITNALP